MIERYSRPEMASVFTDQTRIQRWLQVEQAVLEALADEGLAPRSAAEALAAVSSVDPGAVARREEGGVAEQGQG